MKKTICLLLIILFLPVCSFSESYSPGLGMTIADFIYKYNSAPAPIVSPYRSLKEPEKWFTFLDYSCTSYNPDTDFCVQITLMTKDTTQPNSASSGLDCIEISNVYNGDLVSLIAFAERCASFFTEELFGTSFSKLKITEAITYYYDNMLKRKKQMSYVSLDSDQLYALCFAYADSHYYFQIKPVSDIQ